MLYLVPLAGAVVVAWRAMANRKRGTLTPERKAAYTFAMKYVRDPAKLRRLGTAFDKEGLKTQGDNLRARAQLPDIAPKVLAAWEGALKGGLSSRDPAAVEALASAFEQKGAGASAGVLRQYAVGLRAAAPVAPVSVQSAAPPPAPPQATAAPPPEEHPEAVQAPIAPPPEVHAQPSPDVPPS